MVLDKIVAINSPPKVGRVANNFPSSIFISVQSAVSPQFIDPAILGAKSCPSTVAGKRKIFGLNSFIKSDKAIV